MLCSLDGGSVFSLSEIWLRFDARCFSAVVVGIVAFITEKRVSCFLSNVEENTDKSTLIQQKKVSLQ